MLSRERGVPEQVLVTADSMGSSHSQTAGEVSSSNSSEAKSLLDVLKPAQSLSQLKSLS